MTDIIGVLFILKNNPELLIEHTALLLKDAFLSVLPRL